MPLTRLLTALLLSLGLALTTLPPSAVAGNPDVGRAWRPEGDQPCLRRLATKPMPARPASIRATLAGSGTAETDSEPPYVENGWATPETVSVYVPAPRLA